jgi:ABC-type multidrug transport system fused ATPase/permease subunit
LIQQVADQYQSWFPQIAPVIAYSVRRGTDFDRLEREARGSLEELNRIRREFETKSASIISEAQAALEQVRRAAAEVGVAQHAVHFRQEATEHLNRSAKWLIATVVLAASTLAFAAWSVYYYATSASDLSTPQSVQLAVAKVVAFSLLYFAIVWSARMYRSQWHNYVVNKHRQNALSTFETFVKASSDEQTKNAVLLQATQCIFSAQVTGFVAQESDPGPSPQILEIVRGAVGDRSSAH